MNSLVASSLGVQAPKAIWHKLVYYLSTRPNRNLVKFVEHEVQPGGYNT